jgi:hypothetical protein
MAEMRATSVSTVAADDVVLEGPALRFWRGGAGSAWASAWAEFVRSAGCGRMDGIDGRTGCVAVWRGVARVVSAPAGARTGMADAVAGAGCGRSMMTAPSAGPAASGDATMSGAGRED